MKAPAAAAVLACVVRPRPPRTLRAMVATEARKARRLAAALAATGKADATAHVKPTPAPSQAATTHAAARPHAKSPGDAGGRQKTFVGVGSKAGGNYTPPAILRAVANAARNKEKAGGRVDDAASGPSEKADWRCKCGTSNFAKRRECFKCKAPKPGRKFTAAGVKGYEKRQQRREQKRLEAAEAGASGEATKEGATVSSATKTDAAKSVKRRFGDAADAADDDAVKTKTKTNEASSNEHETNKRRKSVKAGDKGKAPKRLRDPDSVLVYLEGWAAAAAEREEKGVAPDAPGFKPRNGWKLDKNIQNWLLHNVFDETQVDDVVFQTTLLYVGGLRGGPLERTREAAREKNVGKGVVAERARSILRALHDGKE